MGIVLIVFSSISAIGLIINLFMMRAAIFKLENIHPSTHISLSAKLYWLYILIFLLIDVLGIWYGRFLIKHPELSKRYQILSILILIIIVFGVPVAMMYLFLPILQYVYSIIQVY